MDDSFVRGRFNRKGNSDTFYLIYDSISLFRSGPENHVCTNGGRFFSVKFRFLHDISYLFAFINAVHENANLFRQPNCIKFTLDQYLCILHPMEGAFTAVRSREEAIQFLDNLLVFLENIENSLDTITPNNRIYTPDSPLDIYKLLPGTNCGDCGYKSCVAFAAMLARHTVEMDQCPFFASPIEEKSIFQVVNPQSNKIETISLSFDSRSRNQKTNKRKVQLFDSQKKLSTLETKSADSATANKMQLLSPLTKREIDVLRLMTTGGTNKEIAGRLSVSENTVKTHISHIFDKLEVNDRTQASIWAVKNGLA